MLYWSMLGKDIANSLNLAQPLLSLGLIAQCFLFSPSFLSSSLSSNQCPNWTRFTLQPFSAAGSLTANGKADLSFQQVVLMMTVAEDKQTGLVKVMIWCAALSAVCVQCESCKEKQFHFQKWWTTDKLNLTMTLKFNVVFFILFIRRRFYPRNHISV